MTYKYYVYSTFHIFSKRVTNKRKYFRETTEILLFTVEQYNVFT